MTAYRTWWTAAGSLALACTATAQATTFNQLVAFGDSLSDNGNVSSLLLPNGPTMRFTTNPGLVAVEQVASHYGLSLTPSIKGGTDYAWGGARADSPGQFLGATLPSTAVQLNAYLAAHQGRANPQALYTYWIGANDLFASLQSGASLSQASRQAIATASAVGQQLASLQHAGARYIVVFNLPDLGTTPSYLGSAQAGAATALSQAYNLQLGQSLAALPNGIIPVNVNALLNQVIAQPGRYGFSNVTQPACTSSSSILCSPATLRDPKAASSYLFADAVHPSTAAHAMLAEAVLSELAAPAQVSLLSEAPLAAIQAQHRALSQQMQDDRLGAATRTFAAIDYSDQHFDSAGAPSAFSHNTHLDLGVDARLNDQLSLGLALGVGQNNASLGAAGGYRMRDVSGAGYAIYHAGGGYVSAYASAGQTHFGQIDRRFAIGAARTGETGQTHGDHQAAGLNGGWMFHFQQLQTGPTAGIEWDAIHIDGYREAGQDATAMWFASQRRLALISHAGWRVQGQFWAGAVSLAPYLTLDWNHDSRAQPDSVTAGLNSMPGRFTLTGFSPDRNWFSGSAGLSARFSPRLQAWLGYSGRFADHSQRLSSYDLGLRFSL